MTNEQVQLVESCVRYIADNEDTPHSRDLKFVLTLLDLEREKNKKLQTDVSNLSCRNLHANDQAHLPPGGGGGARKEQSK